ncbi:1-aminocyclopropane-1-carboxylate deaminase/D-cysteine desulfhydrase [Pseudoalteromonas sp. T1lg65]|uniref:1-aminocyclopropane-1-carboxylate deaminase/D-cysteine desulfhydrase n=1 Tax=Pseudoalteromonas sp. T1lg65 TaxID=2077101 RepID=UPI003F7A01E3
MSLALNLPESPIQTLVHPTLKLHGIRLRVKRDDLLHPVIQGNKWRKLKYNLLEMQHRGLSELVTFGGAFSNHLYATSMACKIFRFTGQIIVRGPLLDHQNPTIKMAQACGLTLHSVTRQEYRERGNKEYVENLKRRFPHAWLIPEGGTNSFAINGVKELANALPNTDYVACAVGSGGTLAGLISGLPNTAHCIGISVLKGADYLQQEINALVTNDRTANWHLLHDYHHGGYAKLTEPLIQFCKTMRRHHHLPLEPIYTGKLLFALFDLIEKGYFKRGSDIIAIHTGGLQGLDGLRYLRSINVS